MEEYVVGEKDIGGFDIPVYDIDPMQFCDRTSNLMKGQLWNECQWKNGRMKGIYWLECVVRAGQKIEKWRSQIQP